MTRKKHRDILVLQLVALGFVLLLCASLLYAASEMVTFPSGMLELHGVVYKPEGRGPFPAVLYNHGSAPG